MDPKEARNYVGYNVHFNPQMNPKPSTSPPNQHWWNQLPAKPLPIKIQRQTSATSDSSPVGSPTSGAASPPNFGSITIDSKTHMPQPHVYKQFQFNQ